MRWNPFLKADWPAGGGSDEGLLKFRPFQEPVFWATEGLLVLHWSRQIGKSYILAAWAVRRLLGNPGRLVTVLSNSKSNGMEFVLKAAQVCGAMRVACESVDLSTNDRIENMRFEIRVKLNGTFSRMIVLAANPRTARGFSGDLILDEFAFHEDSAAIWDAAEPIISSNPDYCCRIASTGNGRFNMFYKMANDLSPYPVSQIRRSAAHEMGLKIYDAATRREITPEEARAAAWDKASYDQNYECAFNDESMALLTMGLISACEYEVGGGEDRGGRSGDRRARECFICSQDWSREGLELLRAS